jgi:hypothetical protein
MQCTAVEVGLVNSLALFQSHERFVIRKSLRPMLDTQAGRHELACDGGFIFECIE